MFSWYERISAACDVPAAFRAVFDELIDEMRLPAKIPTGADRLVGHVPHDPKTPFWRRLREHCSHPGLYIWGAWTGVEMRIQYVGIAGQGKQSTIGRRFRNRYRAELAMAVAYGPKLRRLPETFRGRERTTEEREQDRLKYASVGLEVEDRRHDGRPPRAERYAKVGLENIWYYVLPAPRESLDEVRDGIGVGRQRLRATETALTQCASAWQYAHYRQERAWGFPLLNRENVEPTFVPTADRRGYPEWLEGSWWPR